MVAQVDKNYIQTSKSKLLSRLISYTLVEGRPITTKGRWINPLVFTIFSVEKVLPQLKKVKKPVFIIGTGRSGTTILGIVLSMHKEVGFLNEPKAIWSSVFKEEDLIGNYRDNHASYRLDLKMVTQKKILQMHKIYGAYLRLVRSQRVVDKYPELIFRVPFVKKIFPDAQFLFLVRNGWDTCLSIDMWSKRLATEHNEEIHDWWGVNNRKWILFQNDILKQDPFFETLVPYLGEIDDHKNMAALEWIATMREGLTLLKSHPDDVLRVDYEALVGDPKPALNEITGFCGLSPDSRFLSYGCETLRPVPEKEPFELHKVVAPLFVDTMKRLGYQS